MKLTMDKAAALMEQNNGALDLGGTNITALPDNLTVEGDLDLGGTNITALPDNLMVGGGLFLGCTNIKNQRNRHYLHQGDYVEGRYLYADGILTHVKRKKKFQGYTYFEGKIPSRNVVYDGKNYAHCRTFREGIQDLLFKSAKDRGAEQYRALSLDEERSLEDLMTMYRVIIASAVEKNPRDSFQRTAAKAAVRAAKRLPAPDFIGNATALRAAAGLGPAG